MQELSALGGVHVDVVLELLEPVAHHMRLVRTDYHVLRLIHHDFYMFDTFIYPDPGCFRGSDPDPIFFLKGRIQS